MAMAVCPYCGQPVHGPPATVLAALRAHYRAAGGTHPKVRG